MKKKAWHRRDDETTKAYGQFRTYLELGLSRTFGEAHKIYYGKEKGGSSGRFNDSARKFNWTERAREYDNWGAHIQDKSAEAVYQEEGRTIAQKRQLVNDTAFELFEKLNDKIRQMLRLPITEQIIKDGGKTIIVKPVKFAIRDAAYLADIAMKMGQIAVASTDQGHAFGVDQLTSMLNDSSFRDATLVIAERVAVAKIKYNVKGILKDVGDASVDPGIALIIDGEAKKKDEDNDENNKP